MLKIIKNNLSKCMHLIACQLLLSKCFESHGKYLLFLFVLPDKFNLSGSSQVLYTTPDASSLLLQFTTLWPPMPPLVSSISPVVTLFQPQDKVQPQKTHARKSDNLPQTSALSVPPADRIPQTHPSFSLSFPIHAFCGSQRLSPLGILGISS